MFGIWSIWAIIVLILFCGGGSGLVFGGGAFLVVGGSGCDNMGGASTGDIMLTSTPELAHCAPPPCIKKQTQTTTKGSSKSLVSDMTPPPFGLFPNKRKFSYGMASLRFFPNECVSCK